MEIGPINKYVRHAKKFGPNEVMETAIDDGVSYPDLVDLLLAIDGLAEEYDWRHKFQVGRPPRYRLTPEERVNRLLGIVEDAEKRVDELLADAHDCEVVCLDHCQGPCST